MKKLFPPSILLTTTMLVACGGQEKVVEKPYNKGINITPPLPAELLQKEDTFKLSKSIVFVADNVTTEKVAVYFAAKLETLPVMTLKSKK